MVDPVGLWRGGDMTPSEMLKYTGRMRDQMKAAKKTAVFVGLPVEKVGGKIYGDGRTIIQNGATHEFGGGSNPVRSFLRVPFATNGKELNQAIAAQFESISTGASVDRALGRIGVTAVNISKGAFTTLGYGAWQPITAATKRLKKSSQTLIDTGILRSSISWVIRRAS